MRIPLLLSTLALTIAANAQVIFTSDLETWIGDTIPADWFGVKTNIEVDSIEQVTVNPHGGSLAVRLINHENTTRRFTTQPLQADSSIGYDVTYWVRGQGEVRIAMFDGRTENNGYSPNTSYETVSSNTWTQMTATVICDHTNSAAEFIVYLRNSAGPEHVVLDDVNISVAGVVQPTEASVYGIQYTTDVSGNSPLDGDIVITGGIVTGVDTIGADSYFIQSGTGPFSGLYVYDQAHQPAIGDSLELQGTVDEFNGVTELVSVTGYTVVGQYPLPAPQLLDTYSATLEQWEGVLAVIANAGCTSLPDGFGEWGISQVSGPYIVDDLMFPYTPTVGTNYDITGCIHYANGAWKIEPRFLADIVVATGIEEGVLGAITVGPNPASDVLRINTGITGGRVEYTLTDATGRTVHTGLLLGTGTISMNDLTNGLYHLNLRTANAAKSFAVQVVN